MSTSPQPPPLSDTAPNPDTVTDPLDTSDNEEDLTVYTTTPSDEEEGEEELGMKELTISTTHTDLIVARIDELVRTTMAAKKAQRGSPRTPVHDVLPHVQARPGTR